MKKIDMVLYLGLAASGIVLFASVLTYLPETDALLSIPPTRAFDTIFNDNYPNGSNTNITAWDFNDRFWITGNVVFFPSNNTVNVLDISSNNSRALVNVGGQSEVLKNSTAATAFFRTLVGSGAIEITQLADTIEFSIGGGMGGGQVMQNINNGSGNNLFSSANDGDTVTFIGEGIAISNSSSVVFTLNATITELNDVNTTNVMNDDILIFNSSSGNWINTPATSLPASFTLTDVYFPAQEGSVGDNDHCLEHKEVHFGGSGSNEYDRIVVEFTNEGRCDEAEEGQALTFMYVVDQRYDTDTDFDFRLFWFKNGGSGTVCFEANLLALKEPEDLEVSFTTPKEECRSTLSNDLLTVTSYTFTAAEHEFEAGDLVFFRIERPDGSPNTFGSPVFVLGADLNWIN